MTPEREHVTDGAACWCEPQEVEADGGVVGGTAMNYPCGECGQVVDGAGRHDYTACVRYRWEQAEYEPGRIPPATIKSDIRAVLARIAELEAELARVAPFLALHGFEGYGTDGD